MPAGKAFIRRAITKASAKVDVVSQQPQSVVQAPQPDRLDELFGSDISAESVAAALGAKPANVDVQDLLAKIQCATLPPVMVLELAVWQALAADTEAAKTTSSIAPLYAPYSSSFVDCVAHLFFMGLGGKGRGGERKRVDQCMKLTPLPHPLNKFLLKPKVPKQKSSNT